MEECTQKTTDRLIVLKEKGKLITFINKDKKVIRKIRVDGCVIIDGKRCDWLVINDIDYEHFVELKGNDIVYACEQLSTSIAELSANPTQDEKHSFVIAGKVVPAINTKIQKLKHLFKKRFNCTLIVKSSHFSFDL